MSESAAQTETASLRFQPEPGAWARALEGAGSRPGERARRFREQLGLPTDRPVVMTGHQAQVWHPGILAKYLAADAAARRTGAAAAWIVVDQDDNDPFAVRLPVRRGGRLGVVQAEFGRRATGEDVPTARQPPLPPSSGRLIPGDAEPATGRVLAGAEEIRAALAEASGEASAALQLAAALRRLLSPLIAAAHTVFATDLHRTDLFAELLERMRSDPEACVRAYNAAAARWPAARTAPLGRDGAGSVELPLWRIGPGIGSARRRVYAAELAAAPREELAPRALLMTGLLRLGGCELFVHGTGGGGIGEGSGYDAITEEWLRGWLGEEARPIAVATATLRLPLAPVGSNQDARRWPWLYHRALHDPAVVGDQAMAAEKRRLVGEVRSAKKSQAAEAPYRRMHSLLERYRGAHAAELEELRRRAEAARDAVREAEIAADRTWAFPLYDPERLRALRGRVDAAFA